jgi:phosphoglycerate dehydrogenase-like enzyme
MKDPTPVAVTSRSFSRHPVLRSELLERFANVRFNDDGASLSGEVLIEFLRGARKAITALERLDRHIFEALPELEVVSKYGVGLDMIDLEEMERRGVRLGWTAGVNSRSVAELTVAAAIQLLHLTPEAMVLVREGAWRQIVGRQLTGRTVGVIGCGNVGKEVVRLLQPFRCDILVNDIVEYRDFYQAYDIRPVSLELLLKEADVVTLHVPLDDSTRDLLSARRLRSMRRGAILINTARGGLVDEDELRTMLEEQYLAGAAFDVFASEPPKNLNLLTLPNFMATPHIGGSTEEAILGMGRAAIEGLTNARPVAELQGRTACGS